MTHPSERFHTVHSSMRFITRKRESALNIYTTYISGKEEEVEGLPCTCSSSHMCVHLWNLDGEGWHDLILPFLILSNTYFTFRFYLGMFCCCAYCFLKEGFVTQIGTAFEDIKSDWDFLNLIKSFQFFWMTNFSESFIIQFWRSSTFWKLFIASSIQFL